MCSTLVVAGDGAGQVGPAGTSERSCPEGRISNIFIDNHSIYDLEQIGAPGRPAASTRSPMRCT